MIRPISTRSGQLTAPGQISDETAKRLKDAFEANFTGGNIGRLLVAGEGLTYAPMTIPAADAQLVEQLKWTVEDVARCFQVPGYKLGADATGVTLRNAGALNQDYYSQTLQLLIEAIEVLLDEGLGMPGNYGTDLDGLLRMDAAQRSTASAQAIGAGYLAPNEARLS